MAAACTDSRASLLRRECACRSARFLFARSRSGAQGMRRVPRSNAARTVVQSHDRSCTARHSPASADAGRFGTRQRSCAADAPTRSGCHGASDLGRRPGRYDGEQVPFLLPGRHLVPIVDSDRRDPIWSQPETFSSGRATGHRFSTSSTTRGRLRAVRFEAWRRPSRHGRWNASDSEPTHLPRRSSAFGWWRQGSRSLLVQPPVIVDEGAWCCIPICSFPTIV